MRKDFAKIAIVLDRSGSMQSIKDDTIGGFNAFIEEQKKTGLQIALSLFQFDDQYDVVYDFAPIDEVKPLDDTTFVPRGSTALYDAVGRSVVSVGERLAALPEADRPASVIVAIITDGQENSSKEYTSGRVKQMIEHQQAAYNWKFVFLGANQDAILAAGAIGIQRETTMTYAATDIGTRAAHYAFARRSAHFLRSTAMDAGDTQLLHFTDEDRKEQRDQGAKDSS